MRIRRTVLAATTVAMTVLGAGCERRAREPVLPEPDSVAAWFGEGTEVELDGSVLTIRGAMDPDYLRRGGTIWERSGPYFYLFNVRVRDLLRDYPDLAAVYAVTLGADGRAIARAILDRNELSEIQWREALARASLAQRQGTENPRRIEELIGYGEDHTDFWYAR